MKKILITLLSFTFLLTACSERNPTNEPIDSQISTSISEQASEYDPFAQSDDNISSVTVGSYGAGVEWEEGRELILDYSSTVSFDYYVDNSGKIADFGLLLFVNGIRQPYYTEENPENKVMHIFEVNEQSRKVQTILFEPVVGEKDDTLLIEIVTMFQPNFINKENSNYEFNHRITSLYPSCMTITDETGLINPKVCDKYEVTSITTELRQEFDEVGPTGEYGGNSLDKEVSIEILKNNVFYTPADRLKEESDITPFTMNDSVTLCMYGGASCKYRVSMYINHELVTGAFDGADYIDITTTSDTICKKLIDLSALKPTLDEYNHLYFLAVPFYTNNNYDERMVLKSASITLENQT